MNKYLIRLDDACPTMDSVKWQRIEDLLEKYGIRPMVGVIPNNADPKQKIDVEDPEFWYRVGIWKEKQWSIALHGFDHCYISNEGLNGLNPLWTRSEFAGVTLEKQKEKIREGVKIFRSHGIDPRYFFAPSHTYDKNTLLALKEESNIRIISDTIATKPYKENGFTFIPQVGGHCINMKVPGVWTFCLHPSTMKEKDFNSVEKFLEIHNNEFVAFDSLMLDHIGTKDIFSKILSWLYFTKRKLKKAL